MHQLGIERCIATPHTLHGVWNNTTASITEAYQKTIPLSDTPHQTHIVRAASEYMIDNSLLDRLHNKIPLLALKDQWVLLEMSFQSAPLGLFDIIFELQLQGYEIVLAHPERYLFYHNQFSMYEKLKQSRIKFQVNLLSVTGYYGKDVAVVADKLLKAGMIDYTGTDIHNLRHIAYFGAPVLTKNTLAIEIALENNAFFS
jgi:tyrosine-protein phosphatase YwqE